MPSIPHHKTVKVTRHEWTIGSPDKPTEAKDFYFGVHHIEKQMEALGVDFSYDDAFHVTAGDGGEIVFTVKVKEKN